MRANAPFRRADLEEFDERLLSRASAVVAMQEVHAGNRRPDVIGMRHDCDAGHSLATAVKIAEWEAERHYRATFFVLHTSPYWRYPEFRESCERIAVLGHEIGLHVDCLAEALKTGRDPYLILEDALDELRSYGLPVRGVVGHGNPICYRDKAEDEPGFANDEMFVEHDRGDQNRLLWRGEHRLQLSPRPLADFGLDYDALWAGLPYPFRCSDSGGKWLNPGFEECVDNFTAYRAGGPGARQLHFLWHPDHWLHAFDRQAVAA